MKSVVSRPRHEKRKPVRKSPSSRLDAALDDVWKTRGEVESRRVTLDAIGDCIEECCSRLTDLCRLELTDDDLATIRTAFLKLTILE